VLCGAPLLTDGHRHQKAATRERGTEHAGKRPEPVSA
jgi:hypothetical protein